ncbi:hypothetical protein [Streptomyces sp. 8N616]|uniref:hypothetical protein n=1 Tax=Streptomyces sp. 8N616 TaxID=3457414 RepID=UPI003FCFF0D2
MRPADVRTVFARVRAATEATDRRVEAPSKEREAMRNIAAPLGLGTQKEAYFELATRWRDHFLRQASTEGVTGDRVWVRTGAVLDPAPELAQIKAGDALRAQPLPEESVWAQARHRYEEIFGEKAPALRRGRIVSQFARRILSQARAYQPHAADLVRELEKHVELLGLHETDDDGRLALARRSLGLLDALLATDPGAAGGGGAAKRTVAALADFDLGGVPADRYGVSVKQAQQVAAALAGAAWDMLRLAAGYGPEGEAVLDALRGAARSDQRTASLPDALREARRGIVAVMERSRATSTPVTQPTPPPGRSREVPSPRDPGSVDLTTESSHPPVPEAHTKPAGSRPARRSGGGRTRCPARSPNSAPSWPSWRLVSPAPSRSAGVWWRTDDR